MARDETNDLASGVLAGLDSRGTVLEHEHLVAAADQAQLLQAHAVAGRVRLALDHRLGGDEVLGDGELKDVEPSGHERRGARCDDGPGRAGRDERVEQLTGTGDLGGVVAVEERELAFYLGDVFMGGEYMLVN